MIDESVSPLGSPTHQHVVRTVCASSEEPLVLLPVDATVHALRLAPDRLEPFARATGLDIVGPPA